jgi:hypothetical protein
VCREIGYYSTTVYIPPESWLTDILSRLGNDVVDKAPLNKIITRRLYKPLGQSPVMARTQLDRMLGADEPYLLLK